MTESDVLKIKHKTQNSIILSNGPTVKKSSSNGLKSCKAVIPHWSKNMGFSCFVTPVSAEAIIR